MENENSNSNETPPSQPLDSLSISPQPQMSVKERFDIIRSIGEECIQEDELERLLANKPQPICYDGFEPSGRMHIAQGVMKAINVNKLTSAGCKVKIWIADWFAQLNNKMGGDLKKIQVIGQYLIEIWKAVGMNIEGGQADICQLGMDQRKVNVLAREYCDDIKRKNKPIILSHHMLPGLQEGQEKMSKSDPSSSIYMEDEEADVNVKIKKAFCPPKVVKKNPCLEYIKYIIFPWFNEFTVERKPENGAVRDHFNNDPKAKELVKRVKVCTIDFSSISKLLELGL
ncbi:hypothetical protein DH2020_011687 [Rehmannia glutinosa]|uniref:tyrosine--tRNA ligase n=1 Tax=Rehmannia glutinosa TaxID=99300 RepID=A0ABR0XE53_REHGL